MASTYVRETYNPFSSDKVAEITTDGGTAKGTGPTEEAAIAAAQAQATENAAKAAAESKDE